MNLISKVITVALLFASTTVFAGANPVYIACQDKAGKTLLSGSLPYGSNPDDNVPFDLVDSMGNAPVSEYNDNTSSLVKNGSIEQGNLDFRIKILGKVLDSDPDYLVLSTIPGSSRITKNNQFDLQTKFQGWLSNVNNGATHVNCEAKYSK